MKGKEITKSSDLHMYAHTHKLIVHMYINRILKDFMPSYNINNMTLAMPDEQESVCVLDLSD